MPVISLASGRVVDIRAKLGDDSDQGPVAHAGAEHRYLRRFSDYRHAVADEKLARAQLDRSKLLFDKGAIAAKDLEVAEDTEEKAKVDVETAQEHLKVLGADLNDPAPVVDILAPISGVIVEQNVTNAAGVKTLDNSPNLFTIADLSSVWILCDVYENNLASVHLGEFADVRLNAYPDRLFKGHISNIGPILDPNIRTAKVRLDMANPGMMRLGMFVTATFHGPTAAEARGGARHRRTAPARPRLGLRAGGWTTTSGAWKWWAATCCRTTCRRSSRASSPGSRWCVTRWSCKTRRNNKQIEHS